jgi:hypothetical protein
MDAKPKSPEVSPKGGLAAVGIGALVVACCAGGPLLAGVAGGLALSTVLGVGAGVLVVVVVTALIVVRARRRRACGTSRVETRPAGGA